MAFNLSTQSAKLDEVVGSFGSFAYGMSTMSSGTATVTVPPLIEVHGIVGNVQGATGVGEMVIFTATSGNTFTVETVGEGGSATGTSVVMWIAWGKPRR